MADNEKITAVKTEDGHETVDEILAEILNNDGTFKDEFNSLLAKYIGVSQQEIVVPKVDISDRSDENIPRERAVFESDDVSFEIEKSIDERIEEKLPEAIREMYAEASSDAQRPEFTSTGDVKYPTMGIGAAEQRVVYDADWEEKAKEEAARLERVRQDRMLRGDSTYARTFVAGGMYMSPRSRFVNEPSQNSPYIDPLSMDEDFETADNTSAYYNSDKKPFFPEGFSVIQRNNGTANGKTAKAAKSSKAGSVKVRQKIDESTYESFAYSHEQAEKARTSWLEVEDKSVKKKKKSLFGRKNNSTASARRTPAPAPVSTEDGRDVFVPEAEEEYTQEPVRIFPYDTDVSAVADETEGLRTTVAQIVDKYNKRNEEDERRRIEEEERLKELKRLEEEEKLRKAEELRLLKQDMSPEVAEFIGDMDDDDFGEYEDFSTDSVTKESRTDSKEEVKTAASAVIPGADYLEKLDNADDVISDEMPSAEDNAEAENTDKSPKSKNSRNKRNGGRKK